MDLDDCQNDLQAAFQTEKISRAINECNDIDRLREIALELVKLNQKSKAIAKISALLLINID